MKIGAKRLNFSLPLTLTSLLMCSSFAFAQSKELIIAQISPGQSLHGRSMERIAAELNRQGVKAKTQHDIKEIKGIKQTGEIALIHAVKQNTFQMIPLTDGPCANVAPSCALFSMPFLFKSQKHAEEVADHPTVIKVLNEEFNKQGFELLAVYQHGWKQFFSTAKVLKDPKDFQGLKLRVMQSPAYLSLANSLGASPVPSAMPSVHEQISKGVVGAHENPIWVHKLFNLHALMKNVTLSNHIYGVFYMLVNKDVWQALSPKDQKIVRSVVWDERVRERKESIALSEKVLQEYRAMPDMTVYDPKPEELAAFQKVGEDVLSQSKARISPEIIKIAQDLGQESTVKK